MVLKHEQGNIIFIPQERCCNVSRQQKISSSIKRFPTFLSRGMDLQIGKVRIYIIKRALSSRIDDKIIESN